MIDVSSIIIPSVYFYIILEHNLEFVDCVCISLYNDYAILSLYDGTITVIFC